MFNNQEIILPEKPTESQVHIIATFGLECHGIRKQSLLPSGDKLKKLETQESVFGVSFLKFFVMIASYANEN